MVLMIRRVEEWDTGLEVAESNRADEERQHQTSAFMKEDGISELDIPVDLERSPSSTHQNTDGEFSTTAGTKRPGSNTKFVSLLAGLAALTGVGYGIYLLLDHMGWMPSVQQHESFQGTVASAELALHNTPDDC